MSSNDGRTETFSEEGAKVRAQLSGSVSWDEHEALMLRYQLAETGRFKAEAEVKRLRAELHGSTSKESKRVKEVCDFHDEQWRKAFPRARGLSYPMDGVNAKAVRRALRWGNDVTNLKRVIVGAFASEFHRSKPAYLTLESILRDENRVRGHIERFDEFVSKITGEVMPQETVVAIRKNEEQRERVENRRRERFERLEREDPAEAVLAALSRGGWEWRCHPSTVDSWRAQCPAHGGEHLNLAIFWGDGDVLRTKCFSHGCEQPEVMAALDLPLFQMYRHPKERAA